MTAVRATLKTLVVDDEALVAMLLEDMLADLGHEVVATAGSSQQASKLVRELSIDMAILDVNLNGEETYPIASLLMSRSIPFLFSTGYAASGLKEGWHNVPLLQKPFQTDDLAMAIDRIFFNARKQ